MQKMAVTRDRLKALHIREGEMGVGENYKSLCQTLGGETQKACRLKACSWRGFFLGQTSVSEDMGIAKHLISPAKTGPHQEFKRSVRSPGHRRHGQQIQA